MNRTAIKVGALAIYPGIGVAAVPYLAAALYFFVNKKVPTHLVWTTWYQYWSVYGHDTIQRGRLIFSAALSLAMFVALPLYAAIASRESKRSLHGDARWASPGEIKKAGLL